MAIRTEPFYRHELLVPQTFYDAGVLSRSSFYKIVNGYYLHRFLFPFQEAWLLKPESLYVIERLRDRHKRFNHDGLNRYLWTEQIDTLRNLSGTNNAPGTWPHNKDFDSLVGIVRRDLEFHRAFVVHLEFVITEKMDMHKTYRDYSINLSKNFIPASDYDDSISYHQQAYDWLESLLIDNPSGSTLGDLIDDLDANLSFLESYDPQPKPDRTSTIYNALPAGSGDPVYSMLFSNKQLFLETYMTEDITVDGDTFRLGVHHIGGRVSSYLDNRFYRFHALALPVETTYLDPTLWNPEMGTPDPDLHFSKRLTTNFPVLASFFLRNSRQDDFQRVLDESGIEFDFRDLKHHQFSVVQPVLDLQLLNRPGYQNPNYEFLYRLDERWGTNNLHLYEALFGLNNSINYPKRLRRKERGLLIGTSTRRHVPDIKFRELGYTPALSPDVVLLMKWEHYNNSVTVGYDPLERKTPDVDRIVRHWKSMESSPSHSPFMNEGTTTSGNNYHPDGICLMLADYGHPETVQWMQDEKDMRFYAQHYGEGIYGRKMDYKFKAISGVKSFGPEVQGTDLIRHVSHPHTDLRRDVPVRFHHHISNQYEWKNNAHSLKKVVGVYDGNPTSSLIPTVPRDSSHAPYSHAHGRVHLPLGCHNLAQTFGTVSHYGDRFVQNDDSVRYRRGYTVENKIPSTVFTAIPNPNLLDATRKEVYFNPPFGGPRILVGFDTSVYEVLEQTAEVEAFHMPADAVWLGRSVDPSPFTEDMVWIYRIKYHFKSTYYYKSERYEGNPPTLVTKNEYRTTVESDRNDYYYYSGYVSSNTLGSKFKSLIDVSVVNQTYPHPEGIYLFGGEYTRAYADHNAIVTNSVPGSGLTVYGDETYTPMTDQQALDFVLFRYPLGNPIPVNHSIDPKAYNPNLFSNYGMNPVLLSRMNVPLNLMVVSFFKDSESETAGERPYRANLSLRSDKDYGNASSGRFPLYDGRSLCVNFTTSIPNEHPGTS